MVYLRCFRFVTALKNFFMPTLSNCRANFLKHCFVEHDRWKYSNLAKKEDFFSINVLII